MLRDGRWNCEFACDELGEHAPCKLGGCVVFCEQRAGDIRAETREHARIRLAEHWGHASRECCVHERSKSPATCNVLGREDRGGFAAVEPIEQRLLHKEQFAHAAFVLQHSASCGDEHAALLRNDACVMEISSVQNGAQPRGFGGIAWCASIAQKCECALVLDLQRRVCIA
jgi:hypothetical protein